jgi:hypothetical protein
MPAAARGAFRVMTTAAAMVVVAASLSAQKDNGKPAGGERPKITLTARPAVGIAPARVVLTAELVGGSNDYEDYYCPTVRWEWGDLTSSESGSDCAPFEAGKTEIKRRYTIEHTFDRAGSYKVFFRLKHGSKELAATSVTIKVQPGAHDNDF